MDKLKAGEETTDVGHCERHGEFKQEYIKINGTLRGLSCPECVEESSERMKREDRERWYAERRQHLLESAHIPLRFQDATFANYRPVNDQAEAVMRECQRYCESWPERRKQGSSMILSGRVGTGKTHLACAITQELVRKHMANVRYTSVAQVMRAIRSTYNPAENLNEGEIISRLVNHHLLILDEVGVQIGSDHEHTMLFEILNGRYLAMRPTILVTNLGAKELETAVGERLVDRFRENGAVLNFTWESYRRRVA